MNVPFDDENEAKSCKEYLKDYRLRAEIEEEGRMVERYVFMNFLYHARQSIRTPSTAKLICAANVIFCVFW